jgi:hypothetical protein
MRILRVEIACEGWVAWVEVGLSSIPIRTRMRMPCLPAQVSICLLRAEERKNAESPDHPMAYSGRIVGGQRVQQIGHVAQ